MVKQWLSVGLVAAAFSLMYVPQAAAQAQIETLVQAAVKAQVDNCASVPNQYACVQDYSRLVAAAVSIKTKMGEADKAA